MNHDKNSDYSHNGSTSACLCQFDAGGARAQTARGAIIGLRLTPVFFEAGARPYPSRELYRAYLTQSDIFIGIYRQRYGRVLPTMDTSGLEEEYQLSEGKPRLIYMCGQCSRYVVISVIYHELSSGVRPPAREKESSLARRFTKPRPGLCGWKSENLRIASFFLPPVIIMDGARHDKGGRFAAWEQPELLSEDVRAGFRLLLCDAI